MEIVLEYNALKPAGTTFAFLYGFCCHAEWAGYCIMLGLGWRQGEISTDQPKEEGHVKHMLTIACDLDLIFQRFL